MNFVLIGSLWAPACMASQPDLRDTGNLKQHSARLHYCYQYSALLPLPIRVSAGLAVIGLSGKILIQTLPPRRMCRVLAILAASIWVLVINLVPELAGRIRRSSLWNPQCFPFIRPRCCLRYLTLLGISILFPPPFSTFLPRRTSHINPNLDS